MDEFVFDGFENAVYELKIKGTRQYFELIKIVLSSCSTKTDFINCIPFVYDEYLLKKMCDDENIDMTTTDDKYVFTRKRVR